jgi:hypothetical protein
MAALLWEADVHWQNSKSEQLDGPEFSDLCAKKLGSSLSFAFCANRTTTEKSH